MNRRTGAHLIVLVWSLVAAGAHAEIKARHPPAPREPAIPKLRFSIVNLLAGRINLLGLEDQLRIGLQEKLYESDAPALRDNFLFFGAASKLSPAFLKVGPTLELQLFSLLTLKASAEFYQAFGTFGYLQSFSSAFDDWSESALSRGKDASRNYVTRGVHVLFEPTLRFKLGPIALVDRFSGEYWDVNLRTGDNLFYEPTLDTLVPNRGWVLANDLDLVWVTKVRLVLGVRYSLVAPLYQAEDLRPGEVASPSLNRQQRIGPLLAYTFFRRGWAQFDQPTLVLIVNWYVEHRFRTGADVNQALPYGVLALAFTSDFILKH